MGGSSSKEPSPAPPSPKLKKPWRDMSWSDRSDTLNVLKDFKPENPGVKELKILLHGPVGAGKSSTINSINNIFQGHITTEALADSAKGDDSFTKTYKTYYIEDRSCHGAHYAFAFSDIMGLEEEGKGIKQSDIKLALKGQVKDSYKFNPSSTLTKDDKCYYNNSPSLGDQVHCLVTVVAADKLSLMSQDVIKKLREIRLEASDMGIPQVVLLTRVDIACPLVREDVKNVYKSKYIKQLMEKFSALLGTPMNCILPVKNYHDEIDLNNDVDELLLKALKHIVNFADDYVRKKRN